MHVRKILLLAVAMVAVRVVAQDAAPATPTPEQSAVPAAAAVPAQAAPVGAGVSSTVVPPAGTCVVPGPPVSAAPAADKPATAEDEKDAPAAGATPAAKGAAPAAGKEKSSGGFMGIGKTKVPYTGPVDVVVLPPTPMLDEEGRQRLDPDGKPMLNPPAKQQRDKEGHPLFDDKCKPVMQTPTDMGYDEHGKKIHVEKEKPPKLVPVTITRGTFTFDGVVGKAMLNYDIADLKYMYLYVPGLGVVVVSNLPFPGAKEQPRAFDDKTLTLTVQDHTLQLASDTKLLPGKQKVPESAYVLVDRDFSMEHVRAPIFGFGTLRVAPYAWPGSKPNPKNEGSIAPPPVPVMLRPTLALKPCPAGMMRVGKQALPGTVAVEQPCVPIPKTVPTATAVKLGPTSGAAAASGAVAASGAKGATGAVASTGAVEPQK